MNPSLLLILSKEILALTPGVINPSEIVAVPDNIELLLLGRDCK